MAIARKKVKDVRKRILREAEDIVTDKITDNSVEEMTKIGIVWSGILDLDAAIPPSEVAAMIAASELVRATHYIDSDHHWTNAAAYAALGAHSEPNEGRDEEEDLLSEEEKIAPIGFAPGHIKTSN